MKVQIGDATLYCGDCVEVLRLLPNSSIDSVVTDPPYGLSFMGKRWDYDVPSEEVWRECLRVLKPGGHLLAFAGTRTQHRMAVRIEDAGFEIRDMIAWVYGSGFPKSHNLGKCSSFCADGEPCSVTQSGECDAKQWQGWGTALKPALEPITVARKPLANTVAENVQQWNTGALNIDGCRVEGGERPLIVGENDARKFSGDFKQGSRCEGTTTAGRWPANLIHDGSEEVVAGFPQANSARVGNPNNPHRGVNHTASSYGQGDGKVTHDYRDTGSAARFFYCAKASKADRDEGLEGFEVKKSSVGDNRPGGDFNERLGKTPGVRANHHPTVKPTDLMRYLCRLVTPLGGVVLDPFTGSGSTGKAALLEGFRFVGIEREAEYVEIARARIAAAVPAQGALL